MFDSWYEYEKNFQNEPVITWMKNHIELPIFAIAIYLILVFYVPKHLEKPFMVKPLLAAWNLLLTVFSMIGFTRTVPILVHNLNTYGWKYTICNSDWLDGPSGLWTMLFIFSKFFELFDTMYLVIHQRSVIFLHWFHHVTVLLYCWHAYVMVSAHGLWFAAMNFSVHSIMYCYYFLMLYRPIRKYVRISGPLITTVQLSQMAMGLVVSLAAWYYVGSNPYGTGPSECNIDPANWKLGLAMYFCYFWLFAQLFLDKYIKKKPHQKSVCNASDAAGSFRGSRGGMASESKQPVASKDQKSQKKSKKSKKSE